MLAELNGSENVYHLLVALHLLFVIVGFGSFFVYPLLGSQADKIKGKEAAAISDATLYAAERVTTPLIYAAAIMGLILVAVGPYGFKAHWIGAAIVVVVLAILFAGFVHVPNLKKMNALSHELANMGAPGVGSEMTGPPPQAVEMEKRGKAAARNGAILTLAFLILLTLMVFKPTL